MTDWIQAFFENLKAAYMLRQALIIVFMFTVGFLFNRCMLPEDDREPGFIVKDDGTGVKMSVYALTLAFPVGIALFTVVSFLILLVGMDYKAVYIIAAQVIVLIVAYVWRWYRNHRVSRDLFTVKNAIVIWIVLIMAFVACSGLIPISISNDSMYYFSWYPRTIVQFGGWRDQFDLYLTDVGQGAAIIGTLPYLFGFGETFGIQTFFNLNFVLFFAVAVLDTTGNKIATVIISALLLVSTPFIVLGSWAMANVYFMELFFMTAYMLFRFKRESFGTRTVIPGLLLLACSLMRMEGGIYILFLIAAVSVIGYRARELAIAMILPMALYLGCFTLKIYSSYTIDNPYPFLTPFKAVIQLGAMGAVAFYVLVIRRMLSERLRRSLYLVIPAGLFAVNAALFVVDRERFVANMKAFILNLFRMSGWGIFSYAVVAITVILIIEGSFENWKLNEDEMFWIMLTVGFALVAIAVSFARGSNLYENIGDSGNRVMLQIVPIVVFAVTMLMRRIIDKHETEQES